jgi:hypothetical protein
MPEHIVKFDMPSDATTMMLPQELLAEGGRYAVQIRDGDVYVTGNTSGLLYLAEVLVRCAKGGYVDSFHVHLPFTSDAGPPTTAIRPEVVIFAASEAVL